MINKYKENGLEFIQVENNKGLTITLCSLGAAIFCIDFLGEKMTYSPKNTQDFLRKNVYHGKTIGRVSGRITGNKITIDDKTFTLEENENGNVLHGGENGLSTKTFESQIIQEEQKTQVIFSYISKDGESGFPGNVVVEINYFIYNNENKITIEFKCKTDKKCPISLTNHSYFCLGDSNINNLSLLINASKYILMNNDDLTLLGEEIVPPCLDFRNEKPLIQDINAKQINEGKLRGYDNIFLLDKVKSTQPIVTLKNSKFKLDITTDFDAVVIYSDNYDANFIANNSDERIRRGLAIEPQLNPMKDRLLKPGDIYKHYISYQFKTPIY